MAVDYDAAKERIKDFLKSHYYEDEDEMKIFKYSDQIGRVAKREQVPIYVDLDDVYSHDPELADWIDGNTLRFRSLFYDVIDEMINEFLDGKQVVFVFYYTDINPSILSHLLWMLLTRSYFNDCTWIERLNLLKTM
jgi:DNA replicative helicase MCM subunit Mcm2 (Cdc46/Mcm family)